MDWVVLYASLGARCPGGVVKEVMDILRAVGRRDSVLTGQRVERLVANVNEMLKCYIMRWFEAMAWGDWCTLTASGNSKIFLDAAMECLMMWLIVPSYEHVVVPAELAALVNCRGHNANETLCDMVFVVKVVVDLYEMHYEHGDCAGLGVYPISVAQMAGRLAGIIGDAEMGWVWDAVRHHGPGRLQIDAREVDVARMVARYALVDRCGFLHYRPLMWDRVAHARFVPSATPVATATEASARQSYLEVNRLLRRFLLCLARARVHVSSAVAYDIFEMVEVSY